MANITKLEMRWCEENGVTIDEYKKKYSTEQKDSIRATMKTIVENEASEEKKRKETEKETERKKREAEKLRLKEENDRMREIEKAENKRKREEERENRKNQLKQDRIASIGNWAVGFDFDEKGNIRNTTPNINHLFKKHPAFEGRLCYNSYKNRFIYRKDDEKIYFNDDFYRSAQEFKEKYIDGWKPTQTIDCLKQVAMEMSYNSATNYLDRLKWDGTPRVSTLFIDQLGVEDTELNREMTRQWLVGAIQRLYEPGCANENMLILTGGQGGGKSTTLKWLAGEYCPDEDGRFGFDESISISSKEQDYGMKLQDSWMCCFDEYEQLNKREAGEYKNWLSKTSDSFRAPYGHTVDVYPRHNCYCATSNETAILKDHTGGQERRMWIMKCHSSLENGFEKFESRTDKLRRLVLAEAVHIYKSTPNFIPYIPRELYEELELVQRRHKDYTSDNVGEMLLEILDRPYWLKKNGEIDSVDDLIRQIKFGYQYRCANPGEELGHINFIKQAAVKRIMKDCLGQMKKHDYMRCALDGEWCVIMKNVKINGTQGKWYIRGRWIDKKEEVYEKSVKRYEPNKEIIEQQTEIPDTQGFELPLVVD